MVARPVRVLFACTGLGHERRGFETFTRSCAGALVDAPSIDLRVYAGGWEDHRPDERVVANLRRGGRAAKFVGALLRRDPYFIEQLTFFLALIPSLVRDAPDVVYFADLNLGNACWHWRRLTRARYRLLFYNGGNSRMPFTRCDHVQQVTPAHLEAAVARGESRGYQTLLPHGVDVAGSFVPPDVAERRGARARLGIPVEGEVLLSVGLLDRAVKRTDLLIDALSALPEPRPFLLLAGAEGPDGPTLRARASERLGERWAWRSVPMSRMPEVYRASDRFALFSRGEGFGLAAAEALAAGLPVLAHDDPTTRFVIGEAGLLRDIRDAVTGQAALLELLRSPTTPESGRERHRSVRERFAWELLRPRYEELFQRVAGRSA